MQYKMKKYLAVFLACLVFGVMPLDIVLAETVQTEQDSLEIEGYSPYGTKNEAVRYGETLTLRVKAKSTVSEVFYQWQSGEEENKAADIAGATGAEYTIAKADVSTPKFFQCLVWDDNHREEKLKMRFNVRVDTILMPDGNTKESCSYYPHVWEGNVVTLSPGAESPFEMTYQWAYYDDAAQKWIDLENETGGSYTVSCTADSPVRYQCSIRNAYSKKTVQYYLNRHSADEPEPVKMEFSPNIRDWYIYEQTGDRLMDLSNYSNRWPGQNGAVKITHKDGSELYTSSNFSQNATAIETNEDGSWKAGDYAVVYGYLNLTSSLNIHIVRIEENGCDLIKGTPAVGQTAGAIAPDYQYYRIQPETSGTYEVRISNISGAGKVNLYRENTVTETGVTLQFGSLQEMEFSEARENKLTLTLEGGTSYFLVVRSDAGQSGYDISFDEFTRQLPLDTPVEVNGMREFTFTPEKSGYYTLEYLSNYGEGAYYAANADVYTSGMNRAGSLNESSSPYLRSGIRYNIALSGNYEGVADYETVKFHMVSEENLPEQIVQAALSDGMTVKLDADGILSYEKTGAETNGEIISETRDGQYGVLPDNQSVKKIVIGEGIRKLEEWTFLAFENLTEVALPASLEEIGMRAFSDCTKLSEVSLPEENHLTVIGEEAFLSTPFLNDQTGNYKMLGTIVLKYTGDETETLVPQKTTAIAGSAMRGSDTLEKITILDKVKQIGTLGMADCASLTGIDVPGNVTEISYCAFYHNTAMEQAILKEGVERIGEEAFFACTGLKEVYIPRSVNYIGSHAIGYSDWNSKTYRYQLSEELPTIYCYYNTAGYRYAKSNQIPYELLDEKNLSNEDICHLSYSYRHGIWPVRLNKLEVRFADKILTEGNDYAISYQDASDKTKTVAVITGTGDYFGTRTIELSFDPQGGADPNPDKGDPGQNEINQSKVPSIGASLTDPGTGISYRVTNEDVNHPEVEYLDANGTAKGTIKIPDKILIDGITYQATGIAAGAFSKNKALKRVEIGNGIKTIGKNAFSGCSGLTAVSGGANLVSIGDNAFLKCTSLKKFTLGKNVSKIGKKAFGSCKKLKSITIKTTKLTKKSIGKGAFSGTPSNVKVSVPKKKVKAYKTLLKSKGISKKAKIK